MHHSFQAVRSKKTSGVMPSVMPSVMPLLKASLTLAGHAMAHKGLPSLSCNLWLKQGGNKHHPRTHCSHEQLKFK
jgi:hypothetical protein